MKLLFNRGLHIIMRRYGMGKIDINKWEEEWNDIGCSEEEREELFYKMWEDDRF